MTIQVRPGTWSEASLGLPILAKDGGIWTLVSCTPGAYQTTQPDGVTLLPAVAAVVMQDTRDADRRVTVYPLAWDAPIRIVVSEWASQAFPYEIVDVSVPNERTPGIELAAAELQRRKDQLQADIAAGEARARAAVAAYEAGQPIPVSALPKMTSANSGEAVPYVEPAPVAPPAPGPMPVEYHAPELVGPVAPMSEITEDNLAEAILAAARGEFEEPAPVAPAPVAYGVTVETGGREVEVVVPMASPMPVAPTAHVLVPPDYGHAYPIPEEPAATAVNPPSSPSSADPAAASPLQAMGEVWPVQPLEDATAGEMHTHLILFHGEWTQDVPKKGKALLTELYRLHDELTARPDNPGIGHIHRAKA